MVFQDQLKNNLNPVCFYLLALDQGKFYVGQTRNLYDRWISHNGKYRHSSMFTKKFSVLYLVDTLFPEILDFKHKYAIENELTMQAIEKLGPENVRGGIFYAAKYKECKFLRLRDSVYAERARQTHLKSKRSPMEDESPGPPHDGAIWPDFPSWSWTGLCSTVNLAQAYQESSLVATLLDPLGKL